MHKILDFLKSNWIRFVVGIVMSIAFMCIYIPVNGKWDQLKCYSDGLFVGGGITFFFGLLVLVASEGQFNIFSYYGGRKKKENGYKETYAEYTHRKEDDRKGHHLIFIPYVCIGLFVIGIAGILLAISGGK